MEEGKTVRQSNRWELEWMVYGMDVVLWCLMSIRTSESISGEYCAVKPA